MPNSQYVAYLESTEWREKRDLVLVRAFGRCELLWCPNKACDVHHLTYARIFCEDLDDLIAICRQHHMQLHPQPEAPAQRPRKPRPTVQTQLDLFSTPANDNEPATASPRRVSVPASSTD